ncbi:hypothetical protein L6164_037495 [Bauhinia variegata]|uniref:Uncharacterized protein n=1 Tax=Bauhinia variegata TaxID=167791 RepID=A0ACB9KKE2_BAUVA|nr:hypothetical protein L6164_037495 [Bauhinia variegata]
MRQCKEELKEFEKQDVKYREDLKHLNQKIKKIEDKFEKDSTKVEALLKEYDESKNLIPKLEDSIPKLQKLLLDEEKILEEIKESSNGRVLSSTFPGNWEVDLQDPEKVRATLADKDLNEPCDLKKAIDTIAMLEAQLKELNPNLDCISEYRQKVSLYNERVEEYNRVTQEWEGVKQQYDVWTKRLHIVFVRVIVFT